jgi:hypothetical protein
MSTTTFDIELYPPGRDTTIVGNVITDSGLDDEAAGFYATETLAGTGIGLVWPAYITTGTGTTTRQPVGTWSQIQ